MKFTLQMPYVVRPGALTDGYYTAYVEGPGVNGLNQPKGRSKVSQDIANALAMRSARKWAASARAYAEGRT